MALETTQWSPSALPAEDRVDAWRQAISASHLPWSIQPGEPVPAVAAMESLTRYRIGDLSLVDCRSGPCAGHRGRTELAGTAEDTVGILFVRAGEELVEVQGEQVVVRPGSALVWRSSEHVRFRVSGTLHKWTLLLPGARFPVPGRAVSRLFDGAGVALLAGLLGTTMRSSADLDKRLALPVADAAVDLLAAAVTPGGQSRPEDPSAATWLRVTAHVDRHLRDPDLTPAQMASAGLVSLRSLYVLFSAHEETPSGYVRRRRLEGARRELERAGTRTTVAQVAHGWGFRDQATFGRAFRAAFDRTPDEVRRATRRS